MARSFFYSAPLHTVDQAAGQHVIFYPRFHSELNFTERFGGRQVRVFAPSWRVLPNAVFPALFNPYFHHCRRVTEDYGVGEVYGTKEFTEQVNRSHRQDVKVNGNFGPYN